MVKVGLIGLGAMGKNHLRVLSVMRGFEIVFISDKNADLLTAMSDRYGILGVTNCRDLLPDVDAVIIATPTTTHLEYFRLVAPFVKNVFIEKPIAATVAEARTLGELALQFDVRVQVGFIERFNPVVDTLTTILEDSLEVICVDFTRTNKISSRITDVDVVTDLMIHDIDLALYLNGAVSSVVANGYVESGMISFATVVMGHQNGRMSRLLASRVTDKKLRQIDCTCVDMFVDCDLLRKEVVISKQAVTMQSDPVPYVISAVQKTVAVAPQEALLSELQAFLSRCLSASSCHVPGLSDGILAMEVCNEITEKILMIDRS